MEKRQVAALRNRVLEAMASVVARTPGEFRDQDLAILATIRAAPPASPRHPQWGTLARLVGTYSNAIAKAPAGPERRVDEDFLGCVLWTVWYQVHYGGGWVATGGVHAFLDFLRAAEHSEAVEHYAGRELAELSMFLPQAALTDVARFVGETRLPGMDPVIAILRSLHVPIPGLGGQEPLRTGLGGLPADASAVERDAMQAALIGMTQPTRRGGAGWFAAAAVLVIAAGALAVPVLRGPPVSHAEVGARLPTFPTPQPTVHKDAAGRVAEPTAVAIPAHGIAAYLVKLKTNPDGTLEVPKNFSDAGWYTGRARPGENGPAVIAGHYDSYQGPAVFYKLHTLKKGDVVSVLLADNTAQRWVVERVQKYAKNAFPTAEVYGKTATPTLRLVTCGGSFNQRTKSYDDNVVVYARLG